MLDVDNNLSINNHLDKDIIWQYIWDFNMYSVLIRDLIHQWLNARFEDVFNNY